MQSNLLLSLKSSLKSWSVFLSWSRKTPFAMAFGIGPPDKMQKKIYKQSEKNNMNDKITKHNFYISYHIYLIALIKLMINND